MPQEYKKWDYLMQDGRRKLHPSQHDKVRETYKKLQSLRKTAKVFGVSKRLIQFILNPEGLKKYQEKKRQDKVWLDYYDKDKHTEAIQKYREKKCKAGYTKYKSKKYIKSL